MIKQETLETVCAGLEEMIKKYKRNSNKGDKERLEATKQAHAALRKVILTCTIKGEPHKITPLKFGEKYGWTVIENDHSQKNYCA